jgi:hypothetical protein
MPGNEKWIREHCGRECVKTVIIPLPDDPIPVTMVPSKKMLPALAGAIAAARRT